MALARSTSNAQGRRAVLGQAFVSAAAVSPWAQLPRPRFLVRPAHGDLTVMVHSVVEHPIAH